MNEIKELVNQGRFEKIVSNYSVKEVCSSLNFEELMHVVEYLFYMIFKMTINNNML